MTLPQHLEPFTMQDNPSVLVALKHGKLPYTDETGALLLMKTLVSNLMTIFFFTVYSTYTCTCNYVKWVIHSEIWFCLFVLVCHLLIYTNHAVHVLCFWCISSNLYFCYSFRAPRACGRPVVRVHRPRNHAPVLWADSKDPGTVQPCCQTAHHRYRYRGKHITEIWCLPAGNQIPNKLLLYLIFL